MPPCGFRRFRLHRLTVGCDVGEFEEIVPFVKVEMVLLTSIRAPLRVQVNDSVPAPRGALHHHVGDRRFDADADGDGDGDRGGRGRDADGDGGGGGRVGSGRGCVHRCDRDEECGDEGRLGDMSDMTASLAPTNPKF